MRESDVSSLHQVIFNVFRLTCFLFVGIMTLLIHIVITASIIYNTQLMF